MSEKLKDLFFTKESLNSFADSIKKYYTSFSKDEFLKLIYDETWEALELKAKMRHTTHSLYQCLPKDYVAALVILVKAAHEIKGFEAMVLPDYVEVYGLDRMEESLNALGHFTQYSSSEFAIRPFLDMRPEIVMEYMKLWAENKHENVRRFASEGCRPRLPWAMILPKFIIDPKPVLEVLEKLKDDSSEFVRKSVANNLNDISKDNPGLALDTAVRWFGYSDNTNWIVKHGLRTLFKQGNTRALRLFGFGHPENLQIIDLKLETPTLNIGKNLNFSFKLINEIDENQKVRLEYLISYVKANGKTSDKVFQIVEKDFKPGNHFIKRKQSFDDMTTRKHYPGIHKIAIMVNGEKKAEMEFELLT
ncbi:MAG: DNA alkylation repair protein [Bacteroidales bacterium]